MLSPLFFLIVLCCALEALALSGAGWRGWLIQYLGFWPGLLGDWRPNYPAQGWAMFVTYGFVHAGIWHCGFNMLTLWSLGRPLQEALGYARFGLLYLAGLFGGAVGYALWFAQPQPMVGASGALFGLAGALLWDGLLANWRQVSFAASLRAVALPAGLLVVMNLVMYWAMHGQLAWQTHLGGFLAGALMMALIDRAPDPAK